MVKIKNIPARVIQKVKDRSLQNEKKKLDKINSELIDDLMKIEEGKKSIKEFSIMILGGAWSELDPTIKKLTDCGSKLVILDACDNFKTKKSKKSKNITIINKIISNKKGKATFYETSPPDSSSLFEPNEDLFQTYKTLKHVKLNKSYEVNTTTLKDLGNFKPHYLCMDLQGGEILALEGAGRDFYDNLYVITTESCFIPLYVRHPLFNDYLKFFHSKDYSLIDIGIIRKAHCIDLKLNNDLGSDQLYTDLSFIKEGLNANELTKIILSLLIEYCYSLCYRIYEKYKNNLGPEVRLCFIKLFKRLK